MLKTLKPARAQCVVISFDLAAVHRARQLGGLPIGWVLNDYDAHSRIKYEALQPEFLFCDHLKLPRSGALWRGPWRWAIYEVDSLPLALSLAARGAQLHRDHGGARDERGTRRAQPRTDAAAGRVNESDCDVVVVGAGIHGAGVAQAAAAAGHSVLLLEQTGVAAGSSSRSSKLIHGGLRYLETGQFHLVRESLHERTTLLRLAPELVHLRRFYIPIYRRTRRRPWQLRLGLSLYALLRGGQRRRAVRHRAAARVGSARRSGHERPASACSTTTMPRPTIAHSRCAVAALGAAARCAAALSGALHRRGAARSRGRVSAS